MSGGSATPGMAAIASGHEDAIGSGAVEGGNSAAARRLSAAVTRADDAVWLRDWALKEILLRSVRGVFASGATALMFLLNASMTALYTPYNWTLGLLATVAFVLYTWEMASLLPVACGWRERKMFHPTRHSARVLVECQGRTIALNAPAAARSSFVTAVTLLSPVLFVWGIIEYKTTVNVNYMTDFCLVWSLVFELYFSLALLFRFVNRRFLRTPEQVEQAKRSAGLVVTGKPRGTLRVLTLNANACVGADRRFDVQRVASIIVKSGAQVVALQDLERCTRIGRSGEALPLQRSQVDSLAKLAEVTGMTVEFCPKTAVFGGQFGNAILSRLPIVHAARVHFASWKTHSSNRDDGPMPQCAVAVSVRPKNFRHDVWVISASLGADASGVEQLNEMGELVNFARSLSVFDDAASQANPDAVEVDVGVSQGLLGSRTQALPSNVIVCGDLRSPDSSPAMSFANVAGLSDVGDLRGGVPTGAWGVRKATFPADKPRQNADRVLVRRHAPSVTPTRVEVADSDASNHLPVVVDFVDATHSPM